jgi:RNA polymerase sigma-70 factor (ECF subfamily)
MTDLGTDAFTPVGALGASPGLRPRVTSAERPTESDARRLRSLVESHFDFVWRSLRRLGVDMGDADDGAQQVFLVVARKLETIEPGAERAFLFGTAMRVASDVRRARKRRREVATDGETAERTDPGPLPDETLDRQRARAVLDEVLEAMPMDLRAVFVLYELEELTVPEIASLLDLPSGTAASRLRRAREEFHRIVTRLRAARSHGELR